MTRTLRILIVGDDDLTAWGLFDLLISLGHDVCAVARTEAETLACIKRYEPDLLIVDDGKSNGYRTSDSRPPDLPRRVPGICISSIPRKLQGMDRKTIILQRPFNPEELNRACARALLPADLLADETYPAGWRTTLGETERVSPFDGAPQGQVRSHRIPRRVTVH